MLALVSFLAAVGGSTWYGAFLSPPRAAAVAATAPAAAAAVPTQLAKAIEPATADPDTGGVVKKSVEPPRALPVPGGAILAERARAVGKVVAAMKPKDAIGILEKMTDDEVERIVRQLNAKQMANLLAAMPPDRAAALGRRLLQPGSEP